MYQKPSIILFTHGQLLLNSTSTGSTPIVPPSNTITLPKEKGPQNDISGAKEYHWVEEEEEDTLSSLW